MLNKLKNLTRIRQEAKSGRARMRRQNAGLSLRDLAAALGVDPATLWRWETGRSIPRATAALQWAEALQEVDGVRRSGGQKEVRHGKDASPHA
jgi:transcriptional regulator with XRE-family HTH domain